MLMIKFRSRCESATLMVGPATHLATAQLQLSQNRRSVSLIYSKERKQQLSQFKLIGLQSIIALRMVELVWLITKSIGLRMMGRHLGLSWLILLTINQSLRHKTTQRRIWASLSTSSLYKLSIYMAMDLIQQCYMHK